MKKILLSALILSGLALAASSTLKVVLNGQPSGLSTATVNGQTYIPLTVLQKLNIAYTVQGGTLSIGTAQSATESVTAGGSNQRASLEGCMNEYLFNGIWRIKVTKLERITKDGDPKAPGWGLTLELRNGSKATLDAGMAGMNGNAKQIAFADGSTFDADAYGQDRFYGKLLPGGVAYQVFKFYYPYDTPASDIQTPVKFLLEVDPTGVVGNLKNLGAAFSSATPSFRVHLDCTK